MARRQVAEGEDLLIWSVVASIGYVNKQSPAAEKGWSSKKKPGRYEMLNRASDLLSSCKHGL
jgi:hypothetical protein